MQLNMFQRYRAGEHDAIFVLLNSGAEMQRSGNFIDWTEPDRRIFFLNGPDLGGLFVSILIRIIISIQ